MPPLEALSPWSSRLGLATCPSREASARRHARRRVFTENAVRRAHLGDLDHLVRIEKMCFGNTAWRESDLRDQFDHAFARVAVFVDEGDELGGDQGALGFVLSWDVGEEVQLMRLGVTPEHQKKGIGSLLMDDLVRSVEDRADVITLEVRVSNKRAQAFYEKFGFHNLATRPRYYNNGEDAVLMEYKLGSQHKTK